MLSKGLVQTVNLYKKVLRLLDDLLGAPMKVAKFLRSIAILNKLQDVGWTCKPCADWKPTSQISSDFYIKLTGKKPFL